MLFFKVFGWCVVFFIFFVSAVGGLTVWGEAKTSRREGWFILGVLGFCGAIAWLIQGLYWVS